MAYSVLLVEDDEQIREVITVETAADGDKGMELIHNNEYDLIYRHSCSRGSGGIYFS